MTTCILVRLGCFSWWLNSEKSLLIFLMYILFWFILRQICWWYNNLTNVLHFICQKRGNDPGQDRRGALKNSPCTLPWTHPKVKISLTSLVSLRCKWTILDWNTNPIQSINNAGKHSKYNIPDKMCPSEVRLNFST